LSRWGEIKACEFNACVLMREAERYKLLHFDEFLFRTRLGERDWTDHDERDLLYWLQGAHGVPKFSPSQARNAAQKIAYERRRDSLRDYVNALPQWDGIERVGRAFASAWGARDSELTRAASKNFFIALIARALEPGAQVDTLWVFEGPQGARKSAALRQLGGDFHAEIGAKIGTPDFCANCGDCGLPR
jgi:predicted P-loop ATPase